MNSSRSHRPCNVVNFESLRSSACVSLVAVDTSKANAKAIESLVNLFSVGDGYAQRAEFLAGVETRGVEKLETAETVETAETAETAESHSTLFEV